MMNDSIVRDNDTFNAARSQLSAFAGIIADNAMAGILPDEYWRRKYDEALVIYADECAALDVRVAGWKALREMEDVVVPVDPQDELNCESCQ